MRRPLLAVATALLLATACEPVVEVPQLTVPDSRTGPPQGPFPTGPLVTTRKYFEAPNQLCVEAEVPGGRGRAILECGLDTDPVDRDWWDSNAAGRPYQEM